MPTIPLLPADWPAPASVFAASTTREGGCSSGPYAGFNLAHHVGDKPASVEQNRRLLASSLDFPAEFQWLRQVHGGRAHIVTRAGAPPEADSLISRTPGIALCVLSADCLPVFLCSRAGDEIAIIHAGWRGLKAGIIENTLAAMQTRPRNLHAWLAPAIRSCCYETGEDLPGAFLNSATPTERQQLEPAFTPTPKPGKYLTNLPKIAQVKLRNLGVASLSATPQCTRCHPRLYYSHRHHHPNPTGRMANLIAIRPTPPPFSPTPPKRRAFLFDSGDAPGILETFCFLTCQE